MKHKITRRLILYFSMTLLVFSLLIGSLFSMLFIRYTSSTQQDELRKKAIAIADMLSIMPEFSADRQISQPSPASHAHHGMMGMNHGMMHPSYDAYLRTLDEITQSEVWIVDEQAHTIDFCGQHQAAVSYDTLPPEAAQVISEVFAGEITVNDNFSQVLGTPSITAGAPLRDKDGHIVAALLLHRTLKDMNKAEHDGFLILALCIGTAFLLSILLSYVLARRFIRPLKRMEKTAACLTQGDYTARTGITQDDEIGSLARSLDTLSLRLFEAEQESSRLDKMRQDFITNISHELRTPITVLRGSLEVLQADLITDPKEKQEYLQQMMANIIHLQRLVNDLLELSRLQNTDFTIEKSTINLTEALTDAMHTARPIAGKKNITFNGPEASVPIAIEADYGRIRQMFLIVLDNAVKFSPEGSTIDITISILSPPNRPPKWQIAIRDYGTGIDANELPHIFERFHRSHSNNANGTGLGLAIASRIAERHSIQLHCESTPGQGSCFYFSHE